MQNSDHIELFINDKFNVRIALSEQEFEIGHDRKNCRRISTHAAQGEKVIDQRAAVHRDIEIRSLYTVAILTGAGSVKYSSATPCVNFSRGRTASAGLVAPANTGAN